MDITSIAIGLLSAGGASIILKMMDIWVEEQRAKRDRKNGIVTINEQLEKILKKQDELNTQIKKTDAVTMALARDRIYFLARKWTENRDFDPDNMRDLRDLFTPYKENDGNGLGDDYFDTYRQAYESSKQERNYENKRQNVRHSEIHRNIYNPID